MNILITNDDGISSPGLKTLYNIFKEKHNVYVVAPASEKSGSSHAISLFKPVYYDILEKNIISLEGLPVDCVVAGLKGFFKDTAFDVVLSGINKGPNLGNDIFYSGTFSAAMRGAEEGLLSFAFSLSTYTEPFNFHFFLEHIENIVDKIVNNKEKILLKGKEFFDTIYPGFPGNDPLSLVLNINFPPEQISANAVKPAYISKRDYKDFVSFESKKGEKFCDDRRGDPFL